MHSFVRSAALRTLYVLFVLLSLALATGAPFDWGTNGP
jgi:hypothetical protein